MLNKQVGNNEKLKVKLGTIGQATQLLG